jgi:predicted lipoprotein
MSTAQAPVARAPKNSRGALILSALAAIIVLAGIAYDTKVVRLGGSLDESKQAFSPDEFGQKTFPAIQELVTKRAAEATALGPAVLADKAAAGKQYGVETPTGAIIPVHLIGVLGEGRSGVYDVKVEGAPPEIHIRVQTGPAINGTDLRDVDGDIKFGQFKNQIEFQDAGSGINRAMKKATLDSISGASLTGKTIDVTGVFHLINPKNWLITPVKAAIK